MAVDNRAHIWRPPSADDSLLCNASKGAQRVPIMTVVDLQSLHFFCGKPLVPSLAWTSCQRFSLQPWVVLLCSRGADAYWDLALSASTRAGLALSAECCVIAPCFRFKPFRVLRIQLGFLLLSSPWTAHSLTRLHLVMPCTSSHAWVSIIRHQPNAPWRSFLGVALPWRTTLHLRAGKHTV